MALPNVSAEALEVAMSRFDSELRSSPEWLHWESTAGYKYAIEHNGKRFPVKQIVSIATGIPTSGFSGGDEANGFVRSRGFEIVPLAQNTEVHVWWVYQGGTYDDAWARGVISAPFKDKGGGKPIHWRTLDAVTPGDVIVHCKDHVIKALGRARSQGHPHPEDPSVQQIDVEYFEIEPPIPVEDIRNAVDLPDIPNGPFNQNRTRKQGYLFNFSVAALQRLREKSSAEWPDWAEAVVSEPRDSRIVKIAPGKDASEWDDCLANGYICVGWEEVGDLLKYPTKEELRDAFERQFAEEYKHHAPQITKKANEVWTLRELKPGDRVVANKGISQILGVGTVVEPGYEWRPERDDMNHTVRVAWDTTFAKSIDPQPGWAFSTVAPVSPTLQRLIIGPPVPEGFGLERLLQLLNDSGLHFSAETVSNYLLALQTKRFAILTGISGTGKTQLAIAIAQQFRQQITVTEPTQVPEDALEVIVRPYMLKYRRTVLPTAFTAGLVLPGASGDLASRQIRAIYPGGEQSLTLSRDPDRNVTEVLFKGAFRTWFLNNLVEGDRFLIEPVEARDDDIPLLRFSLPKVAKQTQLLNNYVVTAVRPDWTDNRGLLGYYNPLTGSYTSTPFLRLLLEAQHEVDRADREEGRNPAPFFAILDEMNLARVEHYFSDFLSALESGEPIELHDDPTVESGETSDALPIPRRLQIPANVFFTGTVNVDETTYMFSPKVLDRAFTIEFNDVDLAAHGSDSGAVGDDVGSLQLTQFPGFLLSARKPSTEDWNEFAQLLNGKLHAVLLDLHQLLENDARHFGFRVANEIARFVTLAAEQTNGGSESLYDALDIAILEKVLPKFHGTQQELGSLLTSLFAFSIAGGADHNDGAITTPESWTVKSGQLASLSPASDADTVQPVFPRTAAKLWRMMRRLRQQGFTSFIE